MGQELACKTDHSARSCAIGEARAGGDFGQELIWCPRKRCTNRVPSFVVAAIIGWKMLEPFTNVTGCHACFEQAAS